MKTKNIHSAPVSEEEGAVPKKKVRTAPTNTSLLPPCKVCHEPSAGFHYGVNTCEACKGFFRRSLLRKEEYKCLGNGNCSIQAGKRKICPKCRHERCLAVGMSKEAIKTGRYTHAKRTQDILEYKQMMGLPSDDPVPLPASVSAVSQDSNSSSQLTAASEFHELMGENSQGMGELHASPENVSAASVSLHPSTQAKTSPSGNVPEASGTANPLSPFTSHFDLSTSMSVSSFTENMLDSLLEGQERSDEVTSPQSSISSSPLSSVASPTTPPKTVSSVHGLKDGFDDEECEKIVQELVEAHDRYVISLNLSADELLQKQKACAEACKLRMEMFGPLKQLSEEEYQDIYKQTGLDVDGRQMFLTMLSQFLEDTIRRFTAFVKNIPGFSQLSIKDQIRLIKDNRLEFGLLSNYRGFNQELQVMTMCSGRTICIHEFERFADRTHGLQRFEAARAIEKLKLSHEEEVMVKSLVVVTVGNEDVDEPDKVSVVQWKLARCLLWLLKQNRPDPHRTFAHIISAFCHVRSLTARMYEWIKTRPFEHYSQFKDNALLAEWFSSS